MSETATSHVLLSPERPARQHCLLPDVTPVLRARRQSLQPQRKPGFPTAVQEKNPSCSAPQAAVSGFPMRQKRETCRTKVEPPPYPIVFCVAISPSHHALLAPRKTSFHFRKIHQRAPRLTKRQVVPLVMLLVSCVDFFLVCSKTGGCDCRSVLRPVRPEILIAKGSLRWCLHTAAMAQRPRPVDTAPPSTPDVTWLEKMGANPGKAVRWTTQQQDSLRGRLRCMIPLPPRWFDFFFHLNVPLPTE